LEIFSEAEEISSGIAEDELVHLPFAWCERREHGNSSGSKLSLKSGGGALIKVEVDATRISVFDKEFGGREMYLKAVAIEKGIAIPVLVSLSCEA
jgi:hypothetical protein